MANNSSNSDNLPSQIVAGNAPSMQVPDVQASGTVFKFTDPNSKVTGNTFPSRANLVEILTEDQFNRILQLVKTKILNASNENLSSIRVMVADVAQFKVQIVSNVKNWLVGKGYTITEIEDATGQSTGWKLSW
jgi:hypothetical protein